MASALFWFFYMTLVATTINAWSARTKGSVIIHFFALFFAPLAVYAALEYTDPTYFATHVTPQLTQFRLIMLLLGILGIIWKVVRRPWRTKNRL